VDEHHYLHRNSSLAALRLRGPNGYVMRLELSGPKPSLVFITRKCVILHGTTFSLDLPVRRG